MNNQKLIALTLLLLVGCSSTGPIKKGQYNLFPETVSVRPFGNNYTISAGIDIAGKRNVIATFWPDCLRKYGDIYVGRVLSDDKIEGVRFNGSDPSDRLFTELCQAGMPIAKRMEDSLTPQQKSARDRQTESTIRSLYSR